MTAEEIAACLGRGDRSAVTSKARRLGMVKQPGKGRKPQYDYKESGLQAPYLSEYCRGIEQGYWQLKNKEDGI